MKAYENACYVGFVESNEQLFDEKLNQVNQWTWCRFMQPVVCVGKRVRERFGFAMLRAKDDHSRRNRNQLNQYYAVQIYAAGA